MKNPRSAEPDWWGQTEMSQLVVFLLVVVAGINPHRLGLTRSLESALPVEIPSAPIGDEYVLMKSIILLHESVHQLGADAAALVFWQHEQMGIVNDQIAIRNCVAETDELCIIPGGHERVRRKQRLVQQLRLFGC